MQASTRRTITFQPTPEVQSLIEKAINKAVGRKCGSRAKRGVRTKLINESLRSSFASLIGKKELRFQETVEKKFTPANGVSTPKAGKE